MEKDGEELKIRLNDDWIGDYSINDYYVKMMEQAEDSELKEYFRKNMRDVVLSLQVLNKEERRCLRFQMQS